MSNLTKDISSLTNIPEQTLKEIGKLEKFCISHTFWEDAQKHNDISTIELPYGKLLIQRTEKEILYKFIPSDSLESMLEQVFLFNKSPLIMKAEDVLKKRVEKTYKELL